MPLFENEDRCIALNIEIRPTDNDLGNDLLTDFIGLTMIFVIISLEFITESPSIRICKIQNIFFTFYM